MTPFTSVTGVAAPLLGNDIDTDQIAPIPTRRSLKPDYREMLFHRMRRRDDDSLDPDFALNQARFAEARILVTGRNFGCGSSREAAVWVFVESGIRCIVARSFADLYRENCLQNGVLPVELPPADASRMEEWALAADGAAEFTVDLVTQAITGPDGGTIPFDIGPADRLRLLEGLDDIGLTLKHETEIADWERAARESTPWLQVAVRHP